MLSEGGGSFAGRSRTSAREEDEQKAFSVHSYPRRIETPLFVVVDQGLHTSIKGLACKTLIETRFSLLCRFFGQT